MKGDRLNIGFVRRGFSRSGGAEAYLRRLAGGISAAGYETTLFTGSEWPQQSWSGNRIVQVRSANPLSFADELERINPAKHCDLLVSLERIWRCDFFRAGDGVHRVWLERRAASSKRWQKITQRLRPKHADILRLEQALLAEGGAGRVIANSAMVRDEIIQTYGYPAASIDLVPNGVQVLDFGPAPAKRAAARAQLSLAAQDVAVLFAGSSWERKGLRYAVAAAKEAKNPALQLLVAGRGARRKYRSARTRFLGELDDIRVPLAAADIFILPTLYDPFSNACLEALAAGLPVITTSTNGFSEIIEDGVHGSIVDRAENVSALAAGLDYWGKEEQRVRGRNAILERATCFDLSRNVARTLELLLQDAAKAASTVG